MSHSPADRPIHPFWAPVLLFGFGLAVLAFLIAIDRQEWFHIRPVSGTAQALALAAEKPEGAPRQ